MAIKKIIKKYKIIVDIMRIYVILRLTKRKIERKKQICLKCHKLKTCVK